MKSVTYVSELSVTYVTVWTVRFTHVSELDHAFLLWLIFPQQSHGEGLKILRRCQGKTN